LGGKQERPASQRALKHSCAQFKSNQMSNPDILLSCVLLLLLIVVEIVMANNKRWGFVGMLLRAEN
jgi:hypothetical protein